MCAARGRARSRTAGTPEDVAKVEESYTGQYLRELLGRRSANGHGKRQAAG
jgi:excinuclease ABC subunit A